MSEKLLTIDARAAIVYDVQGCNSGDADGCLYGKNPETWQTMRCQLYKKKKKKDALSCRSTFSGMEILQGGPRSRSNVSAKIDLTEASYLRENSANMNFKRLS
jgi:hypothetical protein